MRALLIKKYGEYYAGQVLNVEPGAIPADTAVYYEDDEVIPRLLVTNNEIDPTSPELAAKLAPKHSETKKKPSK